MFERFTDRARRVLVLAQEEAQSLNHNFLGTEHILLGLVHEGEGVAAKALEQSGLSLDSVRARVMGVIGTGEGIAASGPPPFTPRAKKVLELSLREALQLGHNYIGTEHLLLGLVREGEGVAAQVLSAAGITKDELRTRVIQLLQGYSGASGRGLRFTPAGVVVSARAATIAREETPAAPVGTHHFLIALMGDDKSLAAKVLTSLGVTLGAVKTRIAEMGVKGTSDELAEATQPLTVELAPGIRMVVDDPTVVSSLDLDELRAKFATPPEGPEEGNGSEEGNGDEATG